MIKFRLLIIIFFLFALLSTTINAQLLIEEFSYTVGELTTVSSNWTESPIGSFNIKVISGNLTYSGYPSGNAVGNMIALNGGNSRSGVITNFLNITGNGNSVYASFLLNVTATTDLDATGDYFASFRDTSRSIKRAYVYLKQISPSTYSIGLAKSSSSSLIWYGTTLNTNTTYLIVINYVFQSGLDAINLWVNPSLSGSEPPSDIQITSGTDASNLGGFQFFQRSTSGDEEVDGIRVATSWSQAPLPVELTSFSAIPKGNSIELNWRTATEVNNYGFDVERSNPPLNPLPRGEVKKWQKIGFVPGHGNSNTPIDYSFVDKNPVGATSFYYRLKQIDVDGKYEYSDALLVKLNVPDKAELMQNSPNPFNPSTSIKFFIPNQSDVIIKVYDLLGREVTTLISKNMSKGFHIVFWNGRDKYGNQASSGVYLYRLTAGNFTETKKMTLLK